MDQGNIKTFEDIIRFAISNEEEAAALYSGLAEKAKHTSAQSMFEELAAQEEAHGKALKEKGAAGFPGGGGAEIPDLKMSNYLVDVSIDPDSSYQDILIFAIKNEASAVGLYTDLCARTTDDGAKALFSQIAEEEKLHKLRLETEYDEIVLADN
jgi:rubrerythrin